MKNLTPADVRPTNFESTGTRKLVISSSTDNVETNYKWHGKVSCFRFPYCFKHFKEHPVLHITEACLKHQLTPQYRFLLEARQLLKDCSNATAF